LYTKPTVLYISGCHNNEMNYAIICFTKDTASMNIKKKFVELFAPKETEETIDNNPVLQVSDNIKLYTLERESIHSEHIDDEIEADFFLFATRHQSEKGNLSLCTHCPGNWAKAEAGGEDKKLCIAPALYLRQGFLLLHEFCKDNEELDHEVTLEVTHHGPLIDKPAMFIEIGSKEKDWENDEAGVILAKVIHKLLTEQAPKIEAGEYSNVKIGIGIGGPHYCSNFNKKVMEKDVAFGHIVPKYMLENLDEKMLKQAIERTKEKVDFIVLDWKGLGSARQKIRDLMDKQEIEVIRSHSL